jgi:hypothetical protein
MLICLTAATPGTEKNRESLRTSTQIYLSIYIILNSNRVALLHILLLIKLFLIAMLTENKRKI